MGREFFPALCRVYCTDYIVVLVLWSVNDVCAGRPPGSGALASEGRTPPVSGGQWGQGQRNARAPDGRETVNIPVGRTPEGGSCAPPLSRHGIFIVLCDAGDVCRNWDFDCIGERQGIRS